MSGTNNIVNQYCVGQLDPMKIRRIFLLAARDLYSNPDNYHDYKDVLKSFVYSKDEKLKTFGVELDFLFDKEDTSFFPAVFVGVGGMSFKGSVINKFAGRNDDMSRTDFVDSASTQIRLKYITRQADECLCLAIVGSAFFMGMRPKFMNKLALSDMGLSEISQVTPVKDTPEDYYQVDLAINLQFSYSITSVEESHRIKRFVIDTATI